MIGRTTLWPEAVPLSFVSTEVCVRAFISTWVSRFGVPATHDLRQRGRSSCHLYGLEFELRNGIEKLKGLEGQGLRQRFKLFCIFFC